MPKIFSSITMKHISIKLSYQYHISRGLSKSTRTGSKYRHLRFSPSSSSPQQHLANEDCTCWWRSSKNLGGVCISNVLQDEEANNKYGMYHIVNSRKLQYFSASSSYIGQFILVASWSCLYEYDRALWRREWGAFWSCWWWCDALSLMCVCVIFYSRWCCSIR